MRHKMAAATAGMIGVMLAVTLWTGALRREPFDIGDYSGVDIGAAEAAFEASQANEDLVRLVLALCWRVEAAGDDAARAPLARYGQELLDRAKAETIDLETAAQPEHMLQALRVIRELGAR